MFVQLVLELAHGAEGEAGCDQVIFEYGTVDVEVLAELGSEGGEGVQAQPGQGPQQAALAHPHGQHAGVARAAEGGEAQVQAVSHGAQAHRPVGLTLDSLCDLGVPADLSLDDVDGLHLGGGTAERMMIPGRSSPV
ncbi:hypothetical protein [Cyprinid herpesvirus 3]|uniref:Uncharacterized protein n=1 Tax=Cyprinid herpesvirus 3 TaxID=180230 RepID=A4FTD9_CYHV3|nr:hypothetical protein [Cyprinid herpesvirus 3]